MSLGPVGAAAFWGLGDPPNTSENVVCEQSGAEMPFISSWVCSTSAGFQNRAGAGVVPSGARYKGVPSPLRTRG